MSKSPYELRTELLNMAITVLMAQHNADHARQMQEKHHLETNTVQDFGVPTAPTTDEIIAEAQKLNEFIQTR